MGEHSLLDEDAGEQNLSSETSEFSSGGRVGKVILSEHKASSNLRDAFLTDEKIVPKFNFFSNEGFTLGAGDLDDNSADVEVRILGKEGKADLDLKSDVFLVEGRLGD